MLFRRWASGKSGLPERARFNRGDSNGSLSRRWIDPSPTATVGVGVGGTIGVVVTDALASSVVDAEELADAWSLTSGEVADASVSESEASVSGTLVADVGSGVLL